MVTETSGRVHELEHGVNYEPAGVLITFPTASAAEFGCFDDPAERDEQPDLPRTFYFLKRFEHRPMTKLVQEAVDRCLVEHGGAGEVIERGIAELGDPGEEARRDRGAR